MGNIDHGPVCTTMRMRDGITREQRIELMHYLRTIAYPTASHVDAIGPEIAVWGSRDAWGTS